MIVVKYSANETICAVVTPAQNIAPRKGGRSNYAAQFVACVWMLKTNALQERCYPWCAAVPAL